MRLTTLASAYITNKQLGKAQQLIDRVIGQRETAEAHLIAGSYYMAAQDYRQAVAELQRAQQLNPRCPNGRQPRGRICDDRQPGHGDAIV
jgi:Tfp pilus assembly protein PilF